MDYINLIWLILGITLIFWWIIRFKDDKKNLQHLTLWVLSALIVETIHYFQGGEFSWTEAGKVVVVFIFLIFGIDFLLRKLLKLPVKKYEKDNIAEKKQLESQIIQIPDFFKSILFTFFLIAEIFLVASLVISIFTGFSENFKGDNLQFLITAIILPFVLFQLRKK